jgi:polar amino acid transport system substrate-binding protein
MEAFQELIYTKKIDVSYLTTHTFKLEDTPKAYDMMMARSEPFIGILIEYDIAKEIGRDRISLQRSEVRGQRSGRGMQKVGIGFIGAGSYAQSHLLPNIPKSADVSLKGVLTSTGTSSRSVGEKFGFDFCAASEADIFDSEGINTVFIATRHDSHAEYVLKALKAGKHVFVEKPLCLSIEQLLEISKVYSDLRCRTSDVRLLMVGYNRRFSPLAVKMKEQLGNGPMAMTYRVNAGVIPPESWIHDRELGGGRVIGEVCHFVDFLSFMCSALPSSVHACAMLDPGHLQDTVAVNLTFENGSVGNISYFANGAKRLKKERVEVYANGCTAVLDDFKRLSIYARGKEKATKLVSQDKGQKAEVHAFIDAVLHGKETPIPFEEVHSASLVTFKILESIRAGRVMSIYE